MTIHLTRAIDELKNNLLSLSTLVEEVLHQAVHSYLEVDPKLAKKVIEQDKLIDQKEVYIEELCLKILALHQPVAYDLRFIVAVLKMNNDLERIGDLATNISWRAISLSNLSSEPEIAGNIKLMTEKTKSMLNKSIESLIKMDINIAIAVRDADEEVDDLNRKTYKETQSLITSNPILTKKVLLSLSVSRNLERISDLATNIAEDVMYMINGEIVRHRDHILE